jgi:hypothetical protein
LSQQQPEKLTMASGGGAVQIGGAAATALGQGVAVTIQHHMLPFFNGLQGVVQSERANHNKQWPVLLDGKDAPGFFSATNLEVVAHDENDAGASTS